MGLKRSTKNLIETNRKRATSIWHKSVGNTKTLNGALEANSSSRKSVARYLRVHRRKGNC